MSHTCSITRKTPNTKHTMNMNTRRHFLRKFAVTLGAPLALSPHIFGQDAPKEEILKEDDPTAVALGYKEDTIKVDKVKYPQHKDDQVCEGCALAPVAKEGDRIACTAFQNKLVSKKGWCMAFAKKPA
jgi:hypothetical protein